jgi:hypothetical protein
LVVDVDGSGGIADRGNHNDAATNERVERGIMVKGA